MQAAASGVHKTSREGARTMEEVVVGVFVSMASRNAEQRS
jgi:hypothetical protein